MKHTLIFGALLFCASAAFAGDKLENNGYWWDNLTPSVKLGWVSGYARAMDLAGVMEIASCSATIPLYEEKFPNTSRNEIFEKMCVNPALDYDGIAMGQFVDGMDAFYKNYRNKQLEVGWAIEYARDAIKGKPAQELDSEVTLWRRCSAADKSHPMPRSDGDAAPSKACTPDTK